MTKEFSVDVAVLGSGGAGCAAAITASREGASVALISKESTAMGNTQVSEAAITSSGLVNGDSPEVLKEDMLRGGEFLNSLEIVDTISKNASSAIHFLENLGHRFRKDDNGMLSDKAVTRLGGHTYKRTLCSTGSGPSMSKVLRNIIANTDSISTFEHTLVISLLREEEKITGVLAMDLKSMEPIIFSSKVAILATGGCGWLYYPQTTNTRSATGDGYAIAFEAGATLTDMEMVQFFPFAMNHPPHYAGSMLDEPALAGPKGKLINGSGETVANRAINRMTRAEVTALMAKEIVAGKVTEWGGLKLDLSGNLDVPEMIEYKRINDKKKRFKKVMKAYGKAAFDWREPWDVSPSAHYMMGGVKIDRNGRSSLENLYAIGEVAGGAMGANRLGSTSITDIFVMGMIAGGQAAKSAAGANHKGTKKSLIEKEIGTLQTFFGKKGKKRPIKLKRKLQELMRENVSIVRNEERLKEALSVISAIYADLLTDVFISPVQRYNTEFLDAIELKNMLTCAKIIATCARMRKESRGAHLRLDYPDKDDTNWLKNIIVWKQDNRLHTSLSEITAKEIYERMTSN